MAETTDKNLPAMQSGGKVAAIVPSNFAEVVQIAGAIVRADMAPPTYKGNTEKATVAILAGMEVGLTPFAALQSIAVINNTPAIFGDGLVALVRASGLLEDMEEGLTVDDKGVPELAWCKVKRRGEKTWHERSLTRAECDRAGWTRKQGPWTLTPGRMMTIRVRGWLYRDVFADVLKGLKSAEEVQDMVDITPPAAAGATPAEPQKSDFVEKPKDPPPADPKPEVPKPVAKRGAGKKQQAAPATPPKDAAPDDKKPGVSDVTDLNDLPADGDDTPVNAEPITFEHYKRVGDFFAFSDAWLDDPKRTPDEAKLWEAFYREYIKEKAASPRDAIREAIADTLGLFSAVLAKETQG